MYSKTVKSPFISRTEDEIGHCDLSELEVPEDLKENFEKMEKELLKEAE